MSRILLITPFLLGNSAGGLGAVAIVYILGGGLVLGVIGGSIYAIVKFFR